MVAYFVYECSAFRGGATAKSGENKQILRRFRDK